MGHDSLKYCQCQVLSNSSETGKLTPGRLARFTIRVARLLPAHGVSALVCVAVCASSSLNAAEVLATPQPFVGPKGDYVTEAGALPHVPDSRHGGGAGWGDSALRRGASWGRQRSAARRERADRHRDAAQHGPGADLGTVEGDRDRLPRRRLSGLRRPDAGRRRGDRRHLLVLRAVAGLWGDHSRPWTRSGGGRRASRHVGAREPRWRRNLVRAAAGSLSG